MKQRLPRIAAAIAVCAAVLTGGPAATLSGRITDPAGAVILGAEVQAINVETGVKESAETNDEGLYRIPELQPGMYRVMISKHGFKNLIKPGVELRVQDIVALNFEMQIGSTAESVTVEEGAPLIQAETAMVSKVIDRNLMTQLPSLTRNPYDFMALVPGSSEVIGAGPIPRGVGYVVNGQRAEAGAFLLDGSDNSDTVTSNPAQALPTEAIREYRVLTNSFTAEYGRNLGYVADLVTKSGTNDLHGSLYDYIRNSALAANGFDNNARSVAPAVFNRNQPGGSIGGAAIKDKLFYFGSFESIVIRSIGPSRNYYVPTPQLIAISSPGTQALFRKYPIPSGLSAVDVQTATVTPANGGPSVTLPAFASVSRRGPSEQGAGTPQDTHLATGRADYVLNSRTTVTGRYSYQHGDEFPAVSQPYSVDFDKGQLTRNQNAAAAITRVWSGNLVSESRAVYSRVFVYTPQAGPDSSFRGLTATGVSVTLPFGTDATGGVRNSYQLYQNVNWVRGKHSLKFGAQAVQHRDVLDKPITAQGVIPRFQGVQGLVDGKFDQVRVGIDFQANHVKPGDPIRTPIVAAIDRLHGLFTDAAWFVQDTWKINHRLTLTPGLRWELTGVRHSAGSETADDVNYYLGQGASYFEQFANGSFQSGKRVVRSHPNQFGPRLGLAYDLTGDGRTVFRAGSGVYFENPYGEGKPRITGGATFTNVTLTPQMVDDPYNFGGQTTLAPGIIRVDPNVGSIHAYAWNATLEREVSRSIAVSAAYIGSSDAGLTVIRGENEPTSGRFLGRPAQRLVPALSGFATISTLAHSSYHGFQLASESRTIRGAGLQFGVNYTWSHSIDNASASDSETTGTSQGVIVDPYNLRRDRADSTFDVRHKFATYFAWQVPKLRAGPALLGRIAEGWQTSGILTFQTGQPFEVLDTGAPNRDGSAIYRPRLAGVVAQPFGEDQRRADAVVPNQFFYMPVNAVRRSGSCIAEAAPYACLPNAADPAADMLPRNPFRRPGRISNNLTVARAFRLRERLSLQIRGEFYNAFNHSNLSIAGPVDLASNTILNKPYIVASRTSAGRQVVMAARIQF
jgi:hypothetical protein